MEEIKIQIDCLKTEMQTITNKVYGYSQYGRYPSESDFLEIISLLNEWSNKRQQLIALDECLSAINNNTPHYMTNIFPQPRYNADKTVVMASTILQMKIDTDAIIPPPNTQYDVRYVGEVLYIDDFALCRITANYKQLKDAIDRWADRVGIYNRGK